MADNDRALALAMAERERRRRSEQGEEPEGEERSLLGGAVDGVNRMAAQTVAGMMSYLPRAATDPLVKRNLILDPAQPPQTGPESAFRYIGAAAPMVLGSVYAGGRALASAPGAALKAPGAIRAMLQDIGRFAQSSPGAFYGSEAAGAAAAGLAGHAAREADAGPVGQLAAEAVSGLTVGGLTSALPRTARSARDAVMANLAPMTQEGGMIRAARQTQARAGGAERAQEMAHRLDGIPEGVTPAQWIGDDNLLAQEARILADNPDLLPRVRADLQEARIIAQEELRNARGQARTREDWEHAVLSRVVPPGTTIQRGQTDEMLDRAYQSFRPLYDEAKGYPINANMLRDDILQATDSQDIISTRKERSAVRSWLANQYTSLSDKGIGRTGMVDSSDLIDLRSRIRGERRKQMKAGNMERADLLAQAESTLTSRLHDQLPSEVVETLWAADSQYRKYKVIEDAIYSAGDSSLTPDQLSRSIRSGGLTGESQYARGTDETVQQLREVALAGRSTEEVLGDPRRAALFVRGLDAEGKRAVQADFMNTLFNRARGSATEATDAGVAFVQGNVLMRDINENKKVMRALGMSEPEVSRIANMAREIAILSKKSPGAVANLFEDGPASIMQLVAALVGAKQGQHIAGGGLGSGLVMAQYMSNRARSVLASMTSNEAERLMKEAATDPRLYHALLTKRVSDPKSARDRARYLESWLVASATTGARVEDQE